MLATLELVQDSRYSRKEQQPSDNPRFEYIISWDQIELLPSEGTTEHDLRERMGRGSETIRVSNMGGSEDRSEL